MFRLKRLFIFLSVLFFACGCVQKDSGKRQYHYGLGASLSVPEQWKRAALIPEAMSTSIAFEDGEGALIILTQNYGRDIEKQFEIVFEINRPILQSGLLLFSKHKTKWFLSDKDRITNITYVIKDKQARIFSIVCTSPSINFSSYHQLFDKIARSFDSY